MAWISVNGCSLPPSIISQGQNLQSSCKGKNVLGGVSKEWWMTSPIINEWVFKFCAIRACGSTKTIDLKSQRLPYFYKTRPCGNSELDENPVCGLFPYPITLNCEARICTVFPNRQRLRKKTSKSSEANNISFISVSEAVIFLVDNGPRTYIVVSRGAFLREDNGILTLGNARNFTYRKCMGYDVGKWGSQREILKGDDASVETTFVDSTQEEDNGFEYLTDKQMIVSGKGLEESEEDDDKTKKHITHDAY
ncbi:hypothetical protein QE152_g40163 [Popillia japonica]|uniref:Uncharacterized protein n=1 Tax=Popillia japonica TaxID=7064 RepID=A0AAW1HSB9_POPJA